jgi:hypothetical protein
MEKVGFKGSSTLLLRRRVELVFGRKDCRSGMASSACASHGQLYDACVRQWKGTTAYSGASSKKRFKSCKGIQKDGMGIVFGSVKSRAYHQFPSPESVPVQGALRRRTYGQPLCMHDHN